MGTLPLGKLPPDLLTRLLSNRPMGDPRLRLGPGIGLDCAVIDFGDRCLVAKTDPITFTEEDIGWYAVHVNANDVATTGARPQWFLATLLLPERQAQFDLAADILAQITDACQTLGAELVGGHTEITAGIQRAIVVGTMLGEVDRDRLITPLGARSGDRLLLTKGVPIEATSILAREFSDRLSALPMELLARAREYLRQPGISVVPEALAAAQVPGVSAMHDPTEGGLIGALWELSLAVGLKVVLERQAVPVPAEARAICDALQVEPLEAISSGALLIAVREKAVSDVLSAIRALGVEVAEIGALIPGQGVIVREAGTDRTVPWPTRDALARLFEEAGKES